MRREADANEGDTQGRAVRRGGCRRGPYVVPLLVIAAGCHGSSTEPTPSAPLTPQRDYALHCLGCHGTHGEGAMGPNIQGLKRTDQQIMTVIANGQGKMPAFQGHLTEKEMRELAEYVKTFQYKP